MTMAMLVAPATASATITSMLEICTSLRRSPALRVGVRACVRLECRKTACGMTVAPMMPTASMSARESGMFGVTVALAAAFQSIGASTNSAR